MSQAKVDKYKAEKANRKETVAKEKRNKMLMKVATGVVFAGLAVWVGFSAVDFVKENRPVETIFAQTGALDDYLNELYAEDVTEATE